MGNEVRTVIVGTRQSALALCQTKQVLDDLQRICERQQMPFEFQIKTIVTTGDKILHESLAKIGGKGLFVTEIEQQLLNGEIDLAVHSMKDMPAELPERLSIGAVPKRADVRDALICARTGTDASTGTNLGASTGATRLRDLPHGARVGTSSLRRTAQLLALRPDLRIVSLRGNIDSRLRKLDGGELDAIVLAAAGLERIGWLERVSEFLSVEDCLPAVAQGALALECRTDDEQLLTLLAHYEDRLSRRMVDAERSFLASIQGGCQLPIAGLAQPCLAPDGSDEEWIQLKALVAQLDGSCIYMQSDTGNEPQQLGVRVARAILESGAKELLQTWRG